MHQFIVSLVVLSFPVAVACEPVEHGVEYLDGYLGWNGIMLGMTVDQVEERVGFELDARPYRATEGCRGVGANIEYRDLSLFLCFRGEFSKQQLALIFVRRPGPCPLRDIVQQLKAAVPRLKYQPSPKDPHVSESDSPKPLYVLAQDPDQGVLVGPTEGIWITYANLLD